jgi:HEPN domain-containing protein
MQQHNENDEERLVQTRRWLRYATEDLVEAEAMVRRPQYVPRHACFFAQQAAEKALKAVLVFLQIDIPRLHNLNALRNLIPPDWPLTQEHPDLTDLTEWAIEARYPGDLPPPTAEEAGEAVGQTRAVWNSVHRDLVAHGFAEEQEVDRPQEAD